MSVKFIVQIELSDPLVNKLATYSFINRADWMRYANGSEILPEKHAKVISSLLTRKLKSITPNKTYDLIEDLPERTKKMLIAELGVDIEPMKGLTAYEMIQQIEKEKDGVVIFTAYDEGYQAHLLPRKP